MKHSYTRGFTLIELLVVVLIIGILASIAVPQYKMAVHKARMRAYLPTIRALAEAEELYYLVNSEYTRGVGNREELDVSFPQECTVNATANWRLNCGNHVTFTIFGDAPTAEGGGNPVGIGILYCYDSSQPCGDNQNIRVQKLFEHQPEGGIFESNAGRWGCTCMDRNDAFCSKLCVSVRQGLNPPRQ